MVFFNLTLNPALGAAGVTFFRSQHPTTYHFGILLASQRERSPSRVFGARIGTTYEAVPYGTCDGFMGG
jgi:hypothetical protein